MRTLLLLSPQGLTGLVVALLAAPTALASAPQVSTQPSGVTVFNGSALVERRGEVKLPKGLHRVILSGLPARLDDTSVRITLSGETAPHLVGFAVESIPAAEIVSAEARELEAELEALADARKLIDDARSVLQDRRGFVLALRATMQSRLTLNMALGPIDVVAMSVVHGHASARLKALAAKERALDLEQETNERKRELAQRKLNIIASKRERQTKTVAVDVRQAQGGEVTVEVRYLVPGAYWRNVYDAVLEGASVRFIQYAIVTQQTGEDWENVALKLSSAAAATRVAIPVLSPKLVSFAPPYRPRPRYRRGYYKGGATRGDRARAEAPAPAKPMESSDKAKDEGAEVVTRMSVSEFAATYAVDGRASIASDGTPRKITIGLAPTDAEVLHEATPREQPGATLLVRGRYKGDAPLLPGAVSLYLGGDYIGETAIGFLGTGGELKLPFGRDDRLRVTRKRVSRVVHDKGVFTKDYKLDYEYRIDVENLVGRSVKLSVRDLVPVSTDERIRVELSDQTTPPSPSLPEDNKGVLRWELNLGPGEKRELKLVYSVRYPQTLPVTGVE